jgi:hypothetical protein
MGGSEAMIHCGLLMDDWRWPEGGKPWEGEAPAEPFDFPPRRRENESCARLSFFDHFIAGRAANASAFADGRLGRSLALPHRSLPYNNPAFFRITHSIVSSTRIGTNHQ